MLISLTEWLEYKNIIEYCWLWLYKNPSDKAGEVHWGWLGAGVRVMGGKAIAVVKCSVNDLRTFKGCGMKYVLYLYQCSYLIVNQTTLAYVAQTCSNDQLTANLIKMRYLG